MSNKIKFTTRVVKSTGEVFVVFLNRFQNNKFECYFPYDDMHGELDSDFIRHETKPIDRYVECIPYLVNRGYEMLEYKSRMKYN